MRIKGLFWFSENQKRGFVLLFFLLAILFGVEQVSHIYSEPVPRKNDTSFWALVDSVIPFLEDCGSGKKSFSDSRTWSLHSFDPNGVGQRELKVMGFDSSEIANIENFRKAGGRFLGREDFLRLYSISKKEYLEVYPYLQIESCGNHSKKEILSDRRIVSKGIRNKKHRALAMVDLNGSDSLDLQKVYGIGPVLAKRIVRFRHLLGGFYCKEQLEEVYGMPKKWVEEIKKQVFVNKGMIRKRDINQAGFKSLVRHPYINYEQAKKIMNLRTQSGPLKNFKPLLQDSVFTEADTLRLCYYWFCHP